MTSWIVVALLQAAMGDPTAPAAETPAVEATAPAPAPAAAEPQRQRVCRREESSGTGRRIGRRVCTMEIVPQAPAAPEPATEATTAPAEDSTGGGAPSGAINTAPAPESVTP